jgi:hypothetical protein
MSISSDKPLSSLASPMQPASPPINASSAGAKSEYSPRGAFLVAGISVGLLFVGWLAFYFLLFLPRGSVG